MTLSQLLVSRPGLVRQARLANTAHAYVILRRLGERIHRARLRGPVRLEGADPSADRYAPRLLALRGSQAVLDEHFDDGDLVRLVDALAFAAPASGSDTVFDFHLEELGTRHAAQLGRVLREAGIELNEITPEDVSTGETEDRLNP